MKLSCENSRPLVPVYLDGELTEEQAAPLRAHLFDCPGCREVAKEGKALARWFAHGALEVAVPDGFAARVARRAMAGDPGLPDQSEPFGLAGLLERRSARRSGRGSLLPFLLSSSALAAGLLFALAVALQRQTLPAQNGLDAASPPRWAMPETLRAPALGAPANDMGADRDADRDNGDAEDTREREQNR